MALYRRRRRATAPAAVSAWPFVGMALMISAGFLYGASALVAPWWAVVLLVLVWLALLGLCTAWWTPHPRRLVPVAVGSMVLWFLTLVAGATWWGWGS